IGAPVNPSATMPLNAPVSGCRAADRAPPMITPAATSPVAQGRLDCMSSVDERPIGRRAHPDQAATVSIQVAWILVSKRERNLRDLLSGARELVECPAHDQRETNLTEVHPDVTP